MTELRVHSFLVLFEVMYLYQIIEKELLKMNEIMNELKQMKIEQRSIGRKIQFLTNGAIIFATLYWVKTNESRSHQVLGIITAILAAVSQVMLMTEEIKEIINVPDEDDSEEFDGE